jgi:hypothetical protein
MRGIRPSWKLALIAVLACALPGPARATAGFDVRLTPQTSIGISYIGQIAAALQDHGVKGHVTSRF